MKLSRWDSSIINSVDEITALKYTVAEITGLWISLAEITAIRYALDKDSIIKPLADLTAL